LSGDKSHSADLETLASQVGQKLLEAGQCMVTAESCTGGWIAKCITDIAGSSRWFERGFVTYSNQAKMEMLGVAGSTLKQYGAVSEETVREMAAGALRHSQAQLAVAVSGIAGPGGGTPEKPLGTVWLAWQRQGQTCQTRLFHFDGGREAVRRQAVQKALEGVLNVLGTT